MALKTTRWNLDTCPCVVEFTWDDTLPDASRVHTVAKTTTCAFHLAAPFVPGQILEHASHAPRTENKRKNDVEGEALSRLTGNATYTTTDPASGAIVWKGSTFAWAFNAARVLVVTVTPPLTNAQRNQLQTAVDTKVGAGLVVIQ